MTLVPWPSDEPDAWNRCELDGLEMPGLAHVKVRLSDELDVKKPKGLHGATITRQGYAPAHVVIALRMWEPEQFLAFQQVVVPLRPKVGGKREASPLPINHPKTLMWGINAVSIQSIDDNSGDKGDWYEVVFDCIEHFPPPKLIPATKTFTTKLKAQASVVVRERPRRPSVTNGGP